MSTRILIVLGAAVALLIGVDQWRRSPTFDVVPNSAPVPGANTTIWGTETYTLTGTFLLIDSGLTIQGSHCRGSGGFADVKLGKQVTVTDASGKVIGVGALSEGDLEGSVTCRFGFSVNNLPSVDFYGIEVQRRGRLNYPLAEMKRREWKVELMLSQ